MRTSSDVYTMDDSVTVGEGVVVPNLRKDVNDFYSQILQKMKYLLQQADRKSADLSLLLQLDDLHIALLSLGSNGRLVERAYDAELSMQLRLTLYDMQTSLESIERSLYSQSYSNTSTASSQDLRSISSSLATLSDFRDLAAINHDINIDDGPDGKLRNIMKDFRTGDTDPLPRYQFQNENMPGSNASTTNRERDPQLNPAEPPLSRVLPNSYEAPPERHDDDHNEREWSSYPEDDPWAPMILSLDSGGVRSLSSLLILKTLMERVSYWEQKLEIEGGSGNIDRYNAENLLPCHYFDFMYGTSSGGLIATMLGRLRMSVEHSIDAYGEVCGKMYSGTRSILPWRPKYSHEPFELELRKMVKRHCKIHEGTCDGDDWFSWLKYPSSFAPNANHMEICQSICLTSMHNSKIYEAHLLRTFNMSSENAPNWVTFYNEGDSDLRIWQVARATTATPTLFEPYRILSKGEKVVFADGGVCETNPAAAAWEQSVIMNGEDKEIGLLLSIGTGLPKKTGLSRQRFTARIRSVTEVIGTSRALGHDTEENENTHRNMLSLTLGRHKWYKRLNVEGNLCDTPFDDLEIFNSGSPLEKQIEQLTTNYLNRDVNREIDTYASPKAMLNEIAEKLVRQRRAREATKHENPQRWHTYMGRYLTGQYVDKNDGPEDYYSINAWSAVLATNERVSRLA